MSVVCVFVFQIRLTRPGQTSRSAGRDAQTDGTASEGDDLKLSAEFPVQVPPGQSRVIRMPPGIRNYHSAAAG